MLASFKALKIRLRAERDARHAVELKAQVGKLEKAIEQISQHIVVRQATPSDEEQTQLLDEMKDMQTTSVVLQRRATLRLEYLTSLAEDTNVDGFVVESEMPASTQRGSALSQQSLLSITEDDESRCPQSGDEPPESSRVAGATSTDHLGLVTPVASLNLPFPGTTLSSNTATVSAQEFEERLSILLASASAKQMGTGKPFSDDFIGTIADLLTAVGKHNWSSRPRSYMVLRLINEVKAMDDLVFNGFKDIDFPYTESTVPECIRGLGAHRDFLHAQRYVLSERSADLVRGVRHRHLGMFTLA